MYKTINITHTLKEQHDYRIIAAADCLFSPKDRRVYRGYICEYDEELYFVYDDREEHDLLEEEFWSYVERTFVFEEYDENGCTYFDIESGNIIRIERE